MQVRIENNEGNELYNAGYDLVAMATAVGVTVDKNENVTSSLAVTVEPREGESVAAAKLINYGHVALGKQGVTCDIDFADFRKQLNEKPGEVKGPWMFIFPDTDSALFFISVIHHTDLLKQPKWQNWAVEGEAAEGVETHDADQFTRHYFNKIARNYLAQLTGTSPDSEACKILEGIRQRVGKNLDIIKASRTRISDETKRERMLSKVKEEDKTAVPEAYAKLESGEIDLKEFRNAVKAKKKETAAQERAARKAATGKSSKGASAKPMTEADAAKVANAQAEIAAKKAKAQGEAAPAAPASEE
jgi:hypothetical protein